MPIIVLTADMGAEIDAQCRDAGADDVMRKLVAMDSLFDAIARILASEGTGPVTLQ